MSGHFPDTDVRGHESPTLEQVIKAQALFAKFQTTNIRSLQLNDDDFFTFAYPELEAYQ